MQESSITSDTFSCKCKACNTLVTFDNIKPLPKVWICPLCGSKNYTTPKPKTSQYAPQIRQGDRVINWRIPRVGKVAQQIVIGTAILLLAIGFGGTLFALAKPDSALAAPFRGVVVTLVKTSVGAIELIDGVRGITAAQEREIVSTALQSMMIDEGMQSVPKVISPTRDMASFPSSSYCLFPDYLAKRFSQFRYTVDSDENVVVDTSWSTQDPLLTNLKKQIERLDIRE